MNGYNTTIPGLSLSAPACVSIFITQLLLMGVMCNNVQIMYFHATDAQIILKIYVHIHWGVVATRLLVFHYVGTFCLNSENLSCL